MPSNEAERGLRARLHTRSVVSAHAAPVLTSPRGVFPSAGLVGMWEELIDKWRAYADASWAGDW